MSPPHPFTFISPHFPGAHPLLPWPRLYPYPTPPHAPPPSSFTLLDSGAFGLSQRGQSIDHGHIHRLAAHYRQHAAPAIYCIAPDVYLDPERTMDNWRYWQTHFPDLSIVPVIQFPRPGRLDLYAAQRQAAFYATFRSAHPSPSAFFLAISNPGLTAAQSARQHITEVCTLVRAAAGAAWLHNLGAGWTPTDITAWRQLACFDSIDSIAYYTDAQAGRSWRLDGKIEPAPPAANWRQTAIQNALTAHALAA